MGRLLIRSSSQIYEPEFLASGLGSYDTLSRIVYPTRIPNRPTGGGTS